MHGTLDTLVAKIVMKDGLETFQKTYGFVSIMLTTDCGLETAKGL